MFKHYRLLHDPKKLYVKLCKILFQLHGKSVRIEYDQQSKDRYDRTLGYLYLPDGTFVNSTLIEKDYAFAYTKYPFRHLEKFRKLEWQARSNRFGLWASTLRVAQAPPVTQSGELDCSVHKTYEQFKTCADARLYFTQCNQSRLDGNANGIPCEKLCL